MKTWTEKLPGIIAYIESGNGIAKAKAKKELEKMAIDADISNHFKYLSDFKREWSFKDNLKQKS